MKGNKDFEMKDLTEEDLPKPILIEDLGMMFPNENSKRKYRFGIYKCGFCGEQFRTQIRSVKSGETKSCGCYNKRLLKERKTKHNLSNTKLYRIWRGIKDRTLNLKTVDYINYGGRGITICDEWKNDFKSFYDWAVLNGYEENKGLSIDRINNDGNYEPENCRWTTSTIQNRNTRIHKTNTSGYRGVYFNKENNKYIARINVNGKRIYLGSFLTKEEGAIAYNNYII